MLNKSPRANFRKIGLLFSWLSLLGPPLLGEVLVAGDTPLKTVQEFKAKLDSDNLVALCQLMAESDGSEPLKRSNYEQMQQSMEGLVKLWQGVTFSYSQSSVDVSKEPNKATVTAKVERPKQEVRFSLLKFGTSWYISDIEIFFK